MARAMDRGFRTWVSRSSWGLDGLASGRVSKTTAFVRVSGTICEVTIAWTVERFTHLRAVAVLRAAQLDMANTFPGALDDLGRIVDQGKVGELSRSPSHAGSPRFREISVADPEGHSWGFVSVSTDSWAPPNSPHAGPPGARVWTCAHLARSRTSCRPPRCRLA